MKKPRLFSLLLVISLALTMFTACDNNDSRINTAKATPVAIQEVITLEEYCVFSVDSCTIAKTILPTNPGSSYAYYEADDGKCYVDFCYTYKNLTDAPIVARKTLEATLVYQGRYEYKGVSVVECNNRSDFSSRHSYDIVPLATEFVHLLFEVPEEVATGSGELSVVFNLRNNRYSFSIRGKEASDNPNIENLPS